MSDTVEVLKTARQYIQKGWIQGVSAADAQGVPILYPNPREHGATDYCATGAVHQAAFDLFGESTKLRRTAGWAALEHLSEHVAIGSTQADFAVIGFNDYHARTHKQVLDLFDRTIETITGEPQ